MLVLAYLAAGVFVAGNLYRVVRVARLPRHLRWELYPMPKGWPGEERGTAAAWAAEGAYVAREVFAFATVYRRNRPLWFWSWGMHLGLYGLILTSVMSLLGAPLTAVRAVELPGACLGLLGSVGILISRIGNDGSAPSEHLLPGSRAAVFNLAFLAALFVTGLTVVADPQASAELLAFAAGLRTATAVPLGATAAAHLLIGCAFLMYFPFTHMTHAYMKFFAFHRVRWDDAPLSKAIAREMNANLQRPIGWSAAHVGGGTWAAAAREKR